MDDKLINSEAETGPPKLPSAHTYINIGAGVLLPLIVAVLIWKRLPPAEFTFSRLAWGVLWTYPLMCLGCLAGEFLARQLGREFYSSIGDNPGQMVNLFTGWLLAHSYLVLLAGLFFSLKKFAH